MKPTFLNHDKPILCAMVLCSTPEACIEKIKASVSDGAEAIGIQLEKPFSLYTPDDFRNFPNAELYYAGELNCFYDDITSQPEFLFPRRYSST